MLLHEKQAVYWRLAYLEIEEDYEEPGLTIDDFMPAPFDRERFSEYPPESDWNIPVGDWSDWFPPPPRLTEWELYDLTDWVEIEAAKHDLLPDPDTYLLDDYFFPKEKHDPGNDPDYDPCSTCPHSGASGGLSKRSRCTLSCPLVGTLRG